MFFNFFPDFKESILDIIISTLLHNKFLDNAERCGVIIMLFNFLKSYFEGLTVESTQENIPGNAIIKDSSVIHGPSNYNLHGASKKLNISIRMFKEVKDWKPNTVFSDINFEACNARTYYNDKNTEIAKN